MTCRKCSCVCCCHCPVDAFTWVPVPDATATSYRLVQSESGDESGAVISLGENGVWSVYLQWDGGEMRLVKKQPKKRGADDCMQWAEAGLRMDRRCRNATFDRSQVVR